MELEEVKLIQESTAIIKQNENLVGLGLWNIGNELKYIRDNKTYKQLGNSSFEEFCEEQLNYKKSMAYGFITIAETYKSSFSDRLENIGVRKLLALAKLEEPERNEFITKNDVPAMTTRELEAKVKAELEAKHNEALKQKESVIKKLQKELEEEKDHFQSVNGAYKRLETVNREHYLKRQEAEKELAEIKDTEPKVVEKVIEKEVIPDDYEELKKLKEQQEQTAKEIATRERELKKKQDALDEEQMKFLNNRFDRDKILGFRNKLEKANGVISEEIGKIVMLHFEIEDKSKVDENVRKLIQEMNEQIKKLSGLISCGNQEGIIEGEVLNGTLCE